MLPLLPLIKELSRAWCMAPLELHLVAHDSDRELESLTSVHYVCFLAEIWDVRAGRVLRACFILSFHFTKRGTQTWKASHGPSQRKDKHLSRSSTQVSVSPINQLPGPTL